MSVEYQLEPEVSAAMFSRVLCRSTLAERRQHYGFTFLMDTLQHAIQSLGPRAAPAGIPPVCLLTISSTDVHTVDGGSPKNPADIAEAHTVCGGKSRILESTLVTFYSTQ